MGRSSLLAAGLALTLVSSALGACATTRPDDRVHSTVTYMPVERALHPTRDPERVPPLDRVRDDDDPRTRPTECAAFAPLVREIAADVGVDPGLLAGVATVESGWKPHARSSAGARGLMQIMPSTGRRLDCGDLFAADDNLRCGARLLQRLLARYDGAVDYALAAYALGARAVDRAFKRRDEAMGSPSGLRLEAPRQRFIRRVMSARKAWLQHGCAS